jgi:hypothetical protein
MVDFADLLGDVILIQLHGSLRARIFSISPPASRVWLRSRDEFDYFSCSQNGNRVTALVTVAPFTE